MRRSAGDPRDAARERADAARLRQRLWGAAVLIALAVVGLPLLLDGSGSESRFRRVERLREEPPRIVSTDGADLVRPDAVARSGRDVDREEDERNVARALDRNVGRAPGHESPRTTDDVRESRPGAGDAPDTPRGSPGRALGGTVGREAVQPLHAWVVQAGSFREQRNAIAVRDRLRRAGFPSFVTDTSAPRGAANRAPLPDRAEPLFRVQVGPMVDRGRAEEAREEVVGLLGREAIVVAYP